MNINQLTFENFSPQNRRIFVCAEKKHPQNFSHILSECWESFLLEAGSSGYSAFSSMYEVVFQSIEEGKPHQRVLFSADSAGDELSIYESNGRYLANREPRPGYQSGIEVVNDAEGPARVSLYNNLAKVTNEIVVLPSQAAVFNPSTTFYLYVSVPVVDEDQPVVLESIVEEFDVTRHSRAILLMKGSTLDWKLY